MTVSGMGPETWRLVLTDWFNGNANVTVTLKSGVQIKGKVDQHPSKWLYAMGTLIRANEIHNFDLNEVAAITASAA